MISIQFDWQIYIVSIKISYHSYELDNKSTCRQNLRTFYNTSIEKCFINSQF